MQSFESGSNVLVPSPIPVIHLPAINVARVDEEHSTIDPIAKTAPPNAAVLVRDILSDNGPATRHVTDAVSKMDDTISP